ncbi:phosphomannomutase/phosphoglucomutase [Candidatus Woesearchaeota archaeon]|jgi:phosphomannomutase|nr:phosphomannomutase/phosphoglucomutase [Candidatus Woesearchaeota archaeon]MBT4368416.1 phosphomannomutase/phosphoglucomutase [Candidatus Woesearchaeota archaeon]MBT4712905.1 phosphomannomutase/phosphoglucomutase [Candidatus Woesearchaeota archaeon]MBT6639817.1 phosphomannomutase/phosphoglucomutase [Candidatus Woesearchaeota archaeon]MBT7133989.1 phosphomannomutase/phosphoglucomutase [Candidatus Woesearchaeota archaeon]
MGVFKDKESAFGAYDVRGIYPTQVNEWLVQQIANAFPSIVKTKKVLVGYDARNSSKDLVNATIEGLRLTGVDVYDIGLCTSPKFYFASAFYNFKGGIMITASHNPKDQNGMKFVTSKAFPLSFKQLKKLESKVREKLRITKKKGQHIKLNSDEEYETFLNSNCKIKRKLKIVIDASNGLGGKEIEKALSKQDLIKLNFKPDGNFPAHTPNPIKKATLKELIKTVKSRKADLGLAFDGDADRVVFIDETGTPIKGDYIMALFIDELAEKKDRIVVDLRLSKILEELAKTKKAKIVRSRVGHTFLSRIMRKKKALLGGELSGHYYFRENYYADSALLTTLKVLNILSKNKKPLSLLVKKFQKTFLSDEINFEVEDKEKVLKKFKQFEGKKNYLDGVSVVCEDYRFNVRKSNTQNLIRFRGEAESMAELKETINKVKKTVGVSYKKISYHF